ncbi:MAG: phytoene/squalene synthase family protein [Candidatus Baltobacteraceae bacterium]
MARREAKNFYWGFISLPHEQRMAIYALYDFARQVDDEVDAAPAPALIPERLAAQRSRVLNAFEADDHIMHVLGRAIARYGIPQNELLALIDGVECDLNADRYETWEDLRAYCRLVASAVGRMCVRIFGFTDEAALDRADELGLALQLTNILRDVREDAQMGRVYLPQDELRRFSIDQSRLADGMPGPGWDAFVAFQTARAHDLFAGGYEVLRYIPRRPGACVQTMAGIYEGILRKIERDPQLPFHGRAALSNGEKLRVVVGSWLRPQA